MGIVAGEKRVYIDTSSGEITINGDPLIIRYINRAGEEIQFLKRQDIPYDDVFFRSSEDGDRKELECGYLISKIDSPQYGWTARISMRATKVKDQLIPFKLFLSGTVIEGCAGRVYISLGEFSRTFPVAFRQGKERNAWVRLPV